MPKDEILEEVTHLLGSQRFSTIAELIDMLKKRRNECHTDKNPNNKESEEECKKINNLIEEVQDSLQDSDIQALASRFPKHSLVPIEAKKEEIEYLYKLLQLFKEENYFLSKKVGALKDESKENERYLDKNRALQEKILFLESELKSLKENLEKRFAEFSREEIKDIEKNYDVTIQEKIGATTTFILGAALANINALDGISQVLENNPFSSFGVVHFLSFLAVFYTAYIIFKIIKNHEFRSAIEEICNTAFLKELMNALSRDSFNEDFLIEFLRNRISSQEQRKIRQGKFPKLHKYTIFPSRSWLRKRLGLLEPKSLELMKEALLLHMLQKGVVKHTETNKLNRFYEITDWY